MPLDMGDYLEPIWNPDTGTYEDRYTKVPSQATLQEYGNTSHGRAVQNQIDSDRAAVRQSQSRPTAQLQPMNKTDVNAYNINAWDQMWKDASAARGDGNVLQESQYAGQNQLWADELQRRAMGQGGPSVAEQQLQAGMDTQARQAMSLAASQRGVSPGMALRQAQQAQGQMAAQTNQQAGILRAQEQQAAGQAYQQALAQGMNQEQAWNQAQLAQQQVNDAWAQFGMSGQQAEARYNQLSQMEVDAMNRGDQRMLAQIALEKERLDAQISQAGQARNDNLLGGLFSTAGQLGAAYLMGG